MIEFFFDFGSPTAYLAHTQLPAIAEKHGVELKYEPMLLGGVHKATNNTPPGLVPAKGKYMLLHDMPRFIKRYQVPFKMNPSFPINTLNLMRGCFAAQELGCFDTYVNAVFEGMWVKGINMGNEEVFVQQLTEHNLDAAAIMQLSAEDKIKEKLKANTNLAVEKGAFGAPTMYVGSEMFFGQDRLDFVDEALSR